MPYTLPFVPLPEAYTTALPAIARALLDRGAVLAYEITMPERHSASPDWPLLRVCVPGPQGPLWLDSAAAIAAHEPHAPGLLEAALGLLHHPARHTHPEVLFARWCKAHDCMPSYMACTLLPSGATLGEANPDTALYMRDLAEGAAPVIGAFLCIALPVPPEASHHALLALAAGAARVLEEWRAVHPTGSAPYADPAHLPLTAPSAGAIAATLARA